MRLKDGGTVLVVTDQLGAVPVGHGRTEHGPTQRGKVNGGCASLRKIFNHGITNGKALREQTDEEWNQAAKQGPNVSCVKREMVG